MCQLREKIIWVLILQYFTQAHPIEGLSSKEVFS